MQVLRGADGRLYRLSGDACTVIHEADTIKTAALAEEFDTPSVDDQGAARAYITG